MKFIMLACLLSAFGAIAEDEVPLTSSPEQGLWVRDLAFPPEYPRQAYKKGVTGFVNVMFTINSKGRVRDIEVIESEPPGVFDKSTFRALKRFRYKPTEINSERQPDRVEFTMHFELKPSAV